MELSNVEGFPTEVATSVHNLDKAISTIEEAVAQLISTPLADAHSKVNILTITYTYILFILKPSVLHFIIFVHS